MVCDSVRLEWYPLLKPEIFYLELFQPIFVSNPAIHAQVALQFWCTSRLGSGESRVRLSDPDSGLVLDDLLSQQSDGCEVELAY